MSPGGSEMIALITTSEMGFFLSFFLVFRWLDTVSCSETQVTDAKLMPNIMLLMIAG